MIMDLIYQKWYNINGGVLCHKLGILNEVKRLGSLIQEPNLYGLLAQYAKNNDGFIFTMGRHIPIAAKAVQPELHYKVGWAKNILAGRGVDAQMVKATSKENWFQMISSFQWHNGITMF